MIIFCRNVSETFLGKTNKDNCTQNANEDSESIDLNKSKVEASNTRRITRRTITANISTPKTIFAKSAPVSESKLSLRVLRRSTRVAEKDVAEDLLPDISSTMVGSTGHVDGSVIPIDENINMEQTDDTIQVNISEKRPRNKITDRRNL